MKRKITALGILVLSINLTACSSVKESGETLPLDKEQTIEATTEETIEATIEKTIETTMEETNSEIVQNESSSKVQPVYSSVSYYKSDKLDEYKTYTLLHPEYTLEKIITYVNIGLNHEFYTNTKLINNPDDILVLCNKYNYLPSDYEPSDLVTVTSSNSAVSGLRLRREAAEAFDNLCEGAREAGLQIYGASGYRSYSYQQNLYNRYVQADGVSAADTYSARAGHSEHQTGLAIDVKNSTLPYDRFGETTEYLWAKDNIYKYGFIIHYLPSSMHITGYKSEEWHFRYVGVETATAIQSLGITFDEYFARYLSN